MTKSTITRERLEEWVAQFDEDGGCDATDRQLEALIRQSLAAMDSEPVAEVYQAPNVGICAALGPSIRMLCPLEPGTKLYRHPQPAQELKSVGYLFVSEQGAIAYSPTDWGMPGFRLAGQIFGDIDMELKAVPVVPKDVLEALQKVARIRLDMNDFDGDRRGIADCLCDAEEALIEVVNRRAAMLAAAPQSTGSEPATVPGKWIPVSEQMPDENTEQQVLACFKGGDISTLYYFEGRWDDAYGIVPIRQDVTHWMPLPAAPQEPKP
ncbi:DUF551 domain-containing protein [Klebsiella quasipneumoniae]|nr:DUF551 domain-containing protein [Klebsiella quasipneumoniae]MDZ0185729.1 DUF551 domain-containing protein [Klebsiella quasipneumoniae]